jgi:predicted neuraminidase
VGRVIRKAAPLLFCWTLGSMALVGVPARAAIVRAEIPAPALGENHGAAIAELPSGALLVCWYSGDHEEDWSVRILCSGSQDEGSSWSSPWTAVAPRDRAAGAAADNKSLGNVTLTVTPDGRVWMLHGVIQSRPTPVGNICKNWVCGRIDARVSADGGRTWSTATRLVDLGGALPRAEPKPYGDGWLLPFYLETAQQSVIGRVALTGEAATLRASWPLPGWKLIQPALAPLGDGRFRAFFRDQKREGVYAALFDPEAGAWTTPERTNLPNPGSAIDVFQDDAERFVLIYNPSSTTREILALARSEDGVHFQAGCNLSLPAADAVAAYPSVIRGRKGDWSVVYSANAKGRIRFVRFDSGWLEECFSHKA